MVSFQCRKWICGIKLKTATIIIGVLCILFGLIGLYSIIISGNKARIEKTGLTKASLLIFGVITLLGAVLVGILYIYGAIKGHRKIILVGLLLHFAVAVIDGFLILIGTATRSKYSDDDSVLKDTNKSYRIFNYFFGIALLTIFGAYFLLIVNSFRMQLKIESPKQEPLHISVSEPSSESKMKKYPSEGTYKSQIPGDRLQVQADPIQTAARRLSYKEEIRMLQFKDTQMKDDQTSSGIPQVQADPIQTETRRSSFKEEIRMRQFKETKAQDDETPGDIPFSTLYWEASEQSDGEEESPLITEGVSSHQSQITQTSSSLDATEQSEDEEESPREAERVPSRQSKLTQTSSTSIFQRTT